MDEAKKWADVSQNEKGQVLQKLEARAMTEEAGPEIQQKRLQSLADLRLPEPNQLEKSNSGKVQRELERVVRQPALDSLQLAQVTPELAPDPVAKDQFEGSITHLPASSPVPVPEPVEAIAGRVPVDEQGENLPPASQFKSMPVNPWVMADQDRLSTFGLDTDTASYTLSRRYIASGYQPPSGAVRMEEFVNAFDYNYASQGDDTFAVHTEAAPAPFAQTGTTLVKIGVQARTIGRQGRKPANIVMVVDASGSMAKADRLPLAQQSLKMLNSQLTTGDRVSLVTYGTQSQIVLENAPADTPQQRQAIEQAIDTIQAGDSTNMIDGLQLGYQQAQRHFRAGAINRVMLCSDGVANVGQTDAQAMLDAVAEYRRQGIALTTVGFGVGAYNDDLMEQLANKGDGNYAYVDSEAEAHRVFVEKLSATLQTVAKDAKIQVDFDPRRVRRYRLIGYENRDIADADFRNDTIDAGEVGSGQSATALYEVELLDTKDAQGTLLPLGTVFVRYRDLRTDAIDEISRPIDSTIVRSRTPETDPRFYLAASAAEFAEILRKSEHARGARLESIEAVMQRVVQQLPLDQQARELLMLVQQTHGLPKAP